MLSAEPFRSSIEIEATPDVVFEYFTRPEAIVRWMGDYAALDPRPGGEFMVDVNGVPVRGSYLELEPPHRLKISWGHAGSEQLPPGASIVEIRLTAAEGRTLVELVHTGLPVEQADQHALGWSHFLDRLHVAATGGHPGPDPWATAT
jgi:uncharacterized protein YndB with AHSA1/START domain